MNKQKAQITIKHAASLSSVFCFTDLSEEDGVVMDKIKTLMKGLSKEGLEKLLSVGDKILEDTLDEALVETLFDAPETYIPQRFTRDIEYGSWNVLVQRAKDKRKFWVDVWMDTKYHDILSDWNQYIFSSTDIDDMERQKIQADTTEFDEATSAAIYYLQQEQEVTQDEKGNWYVQSPPEDWNNPF